MASSVGSNIFAILSLLSISLLVLLLLRHYLPLRSTPAYLLVPVFLALALPLSLILLVPIDLASNSRDPDSTSPSSAAFTRAIWLPDRVLLSAWRVSYWLTFALTWLILPLLGEYADSGARTPREKMLYSLRSNARYHLIVLGCGTLGLVYVFLQNGFRGTSVKGLVMALAYCWALIQAIYLMGHGLVAVPRRLFRFASVGRRLKTLQERAPKVHERLEDAVAECQELETQVAQLQKRKIGVAREHQEWIEELADESGSRVMIPTTITAVPPAQVPPLPAAITDRYLADLGRRLARVRHKRLRFVVTWNNLVQEAADTQAILDSKVSKRLDFLGIKGTSTPRKAMGGVALLNPYTRYHLYNHLIPAASLILGAFFALVSICIVWSELVKHSAPQLSIITYIVVKNPDPYAPPPSPDEPFPSSSSPSSADDELNGAKSNVIPFTGQLLTSLTLLYMCTCTLTSLGAVRVWGNRALVPRHTYPESATWYAGQVAKLTVPLTFNFLTFFPPAVAQRTAFYRFLGRLVNLTPLGRGFESWFPVFVLVPVCAALFGVYGMVGRWVSGTFMDAYLGSGDEEDEEGGGGNNVPAFGTGSWREGRALIERALQARADEASVPLVDSARPSLDSRREEQNRYRDEPTLALGPAAQEARGQREARQSRYTDDRERRQRERMEAATRAAAEEDDEGVLGGFAHRVRNTVDSVEAPEWFARRPKWMGGAGDDDHGTLQSGSGRNGRVSGTSGAEDGGGNDFSRAIGRLFGGRGNDGQVRLG